jgi:hypothetical protein
MNLEEKIPQRSQLATANQGLRRFRRGQNNTSFKLETTV